MTESEVSSILNYIGELWPKHAPNDANAELLIAQIRKLDYSLVRAAVQDTRMASSYPFDPARLKIGRAHV